MRGGCLGCRAISGRFLLYCPMWIYFGRHCRRLGHPRLVGRRKGSWTRTISPRSLHQSSWMEESRPHHNRSLAYSIAVPTIHLDPYLALHAIIYHSILLLPPEKKLRTEQRKEHRDTISFWINSPSNLVTKTPDISIFPIIFFYFFNPFHDNFNAISTIYHFC